MKLISHAALVAVLTAGVAATAVTTPAVAQKKKEKDAGAPQLNLSEAIRKPVSEAQAAIAAKDNTTAMAKIAEAEAIAKTDDDRYVVNALKLPIIAQGQDQNALLPVLDALISNPKTPQTDLPRYNYFRGAIPFQNKKYADALPYLTKARDLGYQDQNLALQIAQSMVETGNVAGGVAEIDKAIKAEEAAGRKAPQDWYNYAVAKLFTTGQKGETAAWLQRSVKAYPTTENWRKVILVYRDGREAKGGQPLDRSQRLDLFRLMRATKALADQSDYLEYANLAYQAGLPYETKAVLDEGKATGKIPATNATATQLLRDAQAAIKSDAPLATIEKQASTSGKAAMSAGDVNLALGNYAKAVEFYKLALSKGGVDTSEANLRLGQALTQAGDKAGARTAFQGVTTAPRSEIAGFWTNWMDLSPAAAATGA
ncbi:hypothetical protein [Sphingomonas sp. DT-204]|uniref:hypothetical protein n=1 Tax=Sphingomonas sp. DT-204 TaxID=3396166 RepID=UPI003F1B2B7B